MNVKCTANICKNNKNSKCILKDVSINFDGDPEHFGAFCSCFEESNEYKKSSYELHKLDNNTYLAIRCKTLHDVDIETLLENIEETDKVFIIIDNLVANFTPTESNRFYTFSCSAKSDLDNLYNDIKVSSKLEKHDELVRSLTCDFIRKNKRTGTLIEKYYKSILNGENL